MIFDLDQEIKNLEGETLYDRTLDHILDNAVKRVGLEGRVSDLVQEIREQKGKPLTMGIILRRTLLNIPKDGDVKPDEAQRRYEIAREMMKGGKFDLKENDDQQVIKDNMYIWNLEVRGQLMEILNPHTEKLKK